jgi:hypothetical protein
MKFDMDQNEQSRRQLFSMVQKLKGSMRVYCRVKPLDNYVMGQDSDSYTIAGRASNPDSARCCIEVSNGKMFNGLPIEVNLVSD